MWQEDVCTISRGLSAQHLVGVSMVSIGRHPNWGAQSLLGQTGPSIAPENWYVGGTLAGFQLQQGGIRDGHIGGEQTHIPPGPNNYLYRRYSGEKCAPTSICFAGDLLCHQTLTGS